MSNNNLENLKLKFKELGDKSSHLAESIKDDMKIKLDAIKSKIKEHQKKLEDKSGEVDVVILEEMNEQYDQLNNQFQDLVNSVKK